MKSERQDARIALVCSGVGFAAAAGAAGAAAAGLGAGFGAAGAAAGLGAADGGAAAAGAGVARGAGAEAAGAGAGGAVAAAGGASGALIALTAVLQDPESLPRLRLRHSKASLPPGVTPEQFAMKSERQDERMALIWSGDGCCA
jgi:hypothetical protein